MKSKIFLAILICIPLAWAAGCAVKSETREVQPVSITEETQKPNPGDTGDSGPSAASGAGSQKSDSPSLAGKEEVSPQAGPLNRDDNPIDRAFAEDFAKASATAEIGYVADAYLTAWDKELTHIADVIKGKYAFDSDKEKLDQYVADYRRLAKDAFDLELLNWSDLSQDLPDRTVGTGGPASAMMAQAGMYKQAVYDLAEHLNYFTEGGYAFAYQGKGAELDKLREQNGG